MWTLTQRPALDVLAHGATGVAVVQAHRRTRLNPPVAIGQAKRTIAEPKHRAAGKFPADRRRGSAQIERRGRRTCALGGISFRACLGGRRIGFGLRRTGHFRLGTSLRRTRRVGIGAGLRCTGGIGLSAGLRLDASLFGPIRFLGP